MEKSIVEELKKMNRTLGGISTRIGRLKYDQPIPVFSKDDKGKTIFLFESQEGVEGIKEWFDTDKCKAYKSTAYVVWDGVEIKLFDDLGKGAFE